MIIKILEIANLVKILEILFINNKIILITDFH